jgi:hypothetical protein
VTSSSLRNAQDAGVVIPFRTLKSKHDFSMSQGPMWQFLPPYLVAQDVHVHVPVVPPALPPLMHQKVPSLPSLAGSNDAVHALAVWQLASSYPGLQSHVHAVVVPPTVPPLMHQKVPSLPSLAESDDAVHGSGSHVAAVSTPKLHDDGPDTVYPVSHVG